jgi:hypothetical protein
MDLYRAPSPGPSPAVINSINQDRAARGLPPLTPDDIAFVEPRANQIAGGSYPRHAPGTTGTLPRGWEPFASDRGDQAASSDASSASTDAGSNPGYGMVDRWLFGNPPAPKKDAASGGMLAAYDKATGQGGGMLAGLLGNGPLAQGLPVILAGVASGLANNRGWAGTAARGYLSGMQVGQQFRQQRADEALTRYKLGQYDLQAAADQRLRDTLSNGQLAGLTPDQQRIALALPAEQRGAFIARVAAQRPAEAKAPTIRDFPVGNQVVTRQYDPTKGQWVDLSTAPRWDPGNGPVSWGAPYQDPNTGAWVQKSTRGEIRGVGGGADVSLAQQANNAEIDAARRYLLDNNLAPDEIRRRTQRQTDTGRDNPDFDPNLEATVRTALQHKVGRDDDFSDIQQRLRTGGNAPSAPAGGAGAGSSSSALPRNPAGQLDKAQLKVGQTYDVPGKGAYRWNGLQFAPVQ